MKKTIVTTSWDDGHILDIKLADLMHKYNLTGTFYIAPKNQQIKPDQRLNDAQVRTLSEEFEVGAHTMTHPRLSQIDDDTAQEEITSSRTTLASITGREIKSFCYPFGDYTTKHEKMVKTAGFSIARTVERFRTDIGTDPFAVPTTSHAYRHWSDILNKHPKTPREYFNWDDWAISLFDKANKENGVFHLWGHSWEIEKNHDWDRLEKVFAYISNHSDIDYLTNGQLL